MNEKHSDSIATSLNIIWGALFIIIFYQACGVGTYNVHIINASDIKANCK